MATPEVPDPSAVVADADVLVADVFIDGDAREALDLIRAHGWIDLYASGPLLDDATRLLETLADRSLAESWRDLIEALRLPVSHPSGDQPALASALASGAAHVLSYDPALRSAKAGTAIRSAGPTSVKEPGAFVALFDPATMYDVVVGGTYPGPDRDPRA